MGGSQQQAAVLLVDDGAPADQRLAELLAHWGWPADELRGATAAFGRLCERDYGCVICGHRMSGGDGLALALRWHSIRDPSTPLLVSAPDIDPATRERYGALGVRVLAQDGPSCAQMRLWIAEVLALRSWSEPAPARRGIVGGGRAARWLHHPWHGVLWGAKGWERRSAATPGPRV